MSQNKKPNITFFKPEDFEFDEKTSGINIANKANRLLAERAQVVYGSNCKTEWTTYKKKAELFGAIPSNYKESAYSALLINVQELEKECVEHEPANPKASVIPVYCKHCGLKLRATKWEAI